MSSAWEPVVDLGTVIINHDALDELGAEFHFGSNWTLAVSGGIPVGTDLNGQNLADPDYRVTANLGFSY